MPDQVTLSPSQFLDLLHTAFSDGDLDRVASFVAPNAVDYGANDGTVPGTPQHLEGWNRRRRAFLQVSANMTRTVERTIESGDTVAQLMNTRGTMNGRQFESSAIHIVRVRDGKIVEHWLVAEPFAPTDRVVSPSPTEVLRVGTEQFTAGFPEGGPTLVAPDAVDHSREDGTVPGSPEHVQAWERRRREGRRRMSDVTVTVDRSIENGDTVGQLLTVRGAIDGRRFQSGAMHIVRVRDGKMIEHWAVGEPTLALD